MWRPDFPYQAQAPGVLRGFHRSFCVWSRHWRGTPERPGLVLGLAPGGQCQGVAFSVAAADWTDVKAYLDERELLSYAYAARWLPVELAGEENGATVSAYTFVSDPEHPHYAGELTVERAADVIVAARGIAGLNRDYLIETLRRMAAEGFVDETLILLLRRVEHLTGILESGGGI
jgi:cation transport protein ChaC